MGLGGAVSTHSDIKNRDELWVHSPKTGWMKATARQDLEEFGGSAFLDVYLASAALPGISQATINVNTFDVWQRDDPEALKKIADHFVKPEYAR